MMKARRAKSGRLASRLSPLRRVVVGQLVGQVALVGVTPALTRLYGPSELGIYQSFLSFAIVAQPLATLRIETQVAVTSDRRLLKRRYLVGIAATTLVAMAAFVLGWLIGGSNGLRGAALGGAIIFVYGWMAIDNAFLIRTGAFGALAVRNALGGGIAAALQVGLGFRWDGAESLVIAIVIGRQVAVLVTWRHGRPLLPEAATGDAPYTPRRLAASVASGVVANTATQFLIFATLFFFGAAMAGQVAIAQRVAGTTATLIGQGLAQAFLGKASPGIRSANGALRRQLTPTVRRLAALATVHAAVVATFGPTLLPWLLGPGWERAGGLVVIFAVPLSLQLLVLPLAGVFAPLRREVALLALQVGRLLLTAAAIASAFGLGAGFLASMAAASGCWTISYLVIAALYRHFVDAFDQENRNAYESVATHAVCANTD